MILDTDHPSDMKAILLAVAVDTWEPIPDSDMFRVPSSDGTTMYTTNAQLCTCPARQHGASTCYHSRAVAFYLTLVRAQGRQLRPVPTEREWVQTETQAEFDKRTAPLHDPNRVAELAAKCDDIFSKFAGD